MARWVHVSRDAVMWGRRRENGFWLASTPRRRFMTPWTVPRHDSFFVALGRLRVRIVVRSTDGERAWWLKRVREIRG